MSQMCSSILLIGIKKKRGGNHQKLNRNKGSSKTEALENLSGCVTSWTLYQLFQGDSMADWKDKNPWSFSPTHSQSFFISADTVFSSFTVWLRSCKPPEMLINSSYPLHIWQTESRCLSMINQVAHWEKNLCFTWSFNLLVKNGRIQNQL